MTTEQWQASRNNLKTAKRWVIKIGSALLTNDGTGLNREGMQSWVDQIAGLLQAGHEVVLVSSGSVAEGMTRLGWKTRPDEVHKLQAAAAVGQMGLVQAYETSFSKHGRHTAQVLLTHDDLSDRKRYLNARTTLRTLLDMGVVPIINENDTVVTDEICFGDNDTLGALAANLVEADLLVILTDQDGLYTADPRSNPDATLIFEGMATDPQYAAMAGGGGALGRGGMVTKVRAATLAARSGADTLIVGGRIDNVISRLHQGELVGTLLKAGQAPVAARKQWIAGHLKTSGVLTLDDGAVKALRTGGRSLLPIGVSKAAGRFERGEVVECRDERGQLIAKGLVNYSLSEAQKILKTPTSGLEQALGTVTEPEMIHRDNLVVL
ncbi:MAG: glutamate 5-kinase [Thalassolituus sp.]|jgi:glutamate 5-kinase|uniref:glutamate 5-kinase n=1 Tax=Thalassolituus sp. TaxID=2030822 RepID=UPI0027D5A0C4|nr:glutamate 5-kinase [Thalassolituus sp.]MDQ4424675.1 glutamate 5-kinase [Thalassolituus sp.]MDQ4425254.1 glutamate 5-kinase [Thalassolituus sp.]